MNMGRNRTTGSMFDGSYLPYDHWKALTLQQKADIHNKRKNGPQKYGVLTQEQAVHKPVFYAFSSQQVPTHFVPVNGAMSVASMSQAPSVTSQREILNAVREGQKKFVASTPDYSENKVLSQEHGGSTVANGSTGTFYRLNKSNVQYKATKANKKDSEGALVDRGANGGIFGEDVMIIEESGRHADVSSKKQGSALRSSRRQLDPEGNDGRAASVTIT